MLNQETQRSIDWWEVRRGKASASEISKILGKKDFGLTGESYAFEKATEIVFGLPSEEEMFDSSDTRRGKELEPLAFNKFKDLKEFDFLDVETCGFIEYNDHSGSSPDGLVSDNSNLEIKCPRRDKFFRYIKNGLKEISPEYYAQMQMQMLSTGREKCYFFNYYIQDGFEMWHELIVQRDEDFISFIKERLSIFKSKRDEFVEQIKQNIQFVY